MQILIAVHHFPPRYTGGAEWRAYRTASALQSRGHEVNVLAVERIDVPSPQNITWEDDEYQGVRVRRLFYDLSAAPDAFRWQYDNPWIGDHLRDLIFDRRPDVFHLIGGYLISGRSLRIAAETRTPSVVTLTDFWFLCPRITMLKSNNEISTLPVEPVTCARCLGEEKRRYRLPGKLAPSVMNLYWRMQAKTVGKIEERLDFLKETLNGVDKVISPSQFLRRTYIEWGLPAEKLIFSRQGRDFPGLEPSDIEKKPASRLRIGYLGQIVFLKGVHVLIEAVRSLIDIPLSLQIYGDESHFPDYAAHLRRIAAGDERIEMAGVYPRHALSDILKEIDLLIVPSLWYENSPNVILEAFAHQTPVIASDLGGMAELVENGVNGLLFKVGDAEDLAKQLKKVVESPELLAAFQQEITPVRTVAEEMDELEAIYRDVVVKRANLEMDSVGDQPGVGI
jgi:glycosyltransferase involved in cell wall biosynthesis